MEGKYSIELFRDGGEGAGIEKILVRDDSLTVARALYKVAALNCSERLSMLCDKGARIGAQRPARNDAGNKKSGRARPCGRRLRAGPSRRRRRWWWRNGRRRWRRRCTWRWWRWSRL